MDEEGLLFAKVLRLYCTVDLTNLPNNLHLRLRQLLQQTFSADSVLQVVPRKAIPFMLEYADGTDPDPALTALLPALGMIFTNIYPKSLPGLAVISTIENILRPFCSTLATRASNVFADLCLRRKIIVPPTQPLPTSDNAFEETGCYYGHQPLRVRPYYEGKDVVKERSVKEDGTCTKLYSTYAKNKLTGGNLSCSKNNLTEGIMALWCPHMVCIGFHAMPDCEGRNDVFSAIFCYWQTAPEVIVYDFACQLAPYCLAREPQFFQDTLFVVDQMHATGHNFCSQACFVSNYKQVRPSVMFINCSAAEAANSGLNRIRKSLSYMGERHACLFAYAYMSVWNRKKEIGLIANVEERLSSLNL
jgi:hypothetical protein